MNVRERPYTAIKWSSECSDGTLLLFNGRQGEQKWPYTIAIKWLQGWSNRTLSVFKNIKRRRRSYRVRQAKPTMADSGRHILPAVKKMCTSFFVQTVHVQNSPIVYKCVHALFVHLYMYKILRSYSNVYMYIHYLYICTCTKSSDRIQMCTCIICTFVHVQNPPIVYKCVHALFVHLYQKPDLFAYIVLVKPHETSPV